MVTLIKLRKKDIPIAELRRLCPEYNWAAKRKLVLATSEPVYSNGRFAGYSKTYRHRWTVEGKLRRLVLHRLEADDHNSSIYFPIRLHLSHMYGYRIGEIGIGCESGDFAYWMRSAGRFVRRRGMTEAEQHIAFRAISALHCVFRSLTTP